MQAIWHRIETWLAAHAPPLLASLQAGAQAEEIRRTETVLGVTLPADVKASYRIHNGQAAGSPWLLEEGELLSLADIERGWGSWKELADAGVFADAPGKPSGPIRADWWNPRWIPITHDGSGNHLCLDLAPAPGGTPGQLITVWHDDDQRRLVAPSFSAWLTQLADRLEAGIYRYSESEGGLIRI